jgi:hypothetical protein
MMHPPFCPYQACANHDPAKLPSHVWFEPFGFYSTAAFGMVRRFRCTSCHRTFSEQTFSIDYFAKKIVDYARLQNHLVTTSSIRDMARDFQVHPDTVINKIDRLGRQSLAVHARLSNAIRLREDLVADGFESFTVSQYFPENIHLLVGQQSQFLYHFNHVTIRRKGRMTEKQQKRREKLEKTYRADPRGVKKSFQELLRKALSFSSSSGLFTLWTDKKSDYRWALRSLPEASGRIRHVAVSSKLARTTDNPLFSVNYLDRQLRKDRDEYVRETVCFGRNVGNSMLRFACYQVYHNYQKAFRENLRGRHPWTHAEMAGIPRSEIERVMTDFPIRRRFLSHLSLDGFSRRVWLKKMETPLKKRPQYCPAYAAA